MISLSLKLLRIIVTERFIYVILTLLIGACAYRYYKLLQVGLEYKNLLDALLFTFNDFFHVFFILTNIFFICLYSFNPFTNFNQYLLLKFKNMYKWFFVNIMSIVVTVFSFITFIIILIISMTILNMDVQFSWSNFALTNYDFLKEGNLTKTSPSLILLGNLINCYLFFTTMAIAVFVFSLLFRTMVVSVVFVLLMNAISTGIFLSGKSIFWRYSFVPNVLISDTNTLYNMVKSTSYWLILIFILLVFGYYLIHKIDFNGGEKK